MRLAIDAVFSSWNGKRAIDYRRQNKISDDLGTAVNVQSMVFGNRGERLRHRRGVHPRPVHGRAGPVRRLLGQRPGRGRRGRHPQHPAARRPGAGRRGQLPGLRDVMHTLEQHYRDMCDIEFTIEQGRLWILQTRVGKRTAFGEWVMAYEMLEEGLIDEDEALLRVDAEPTGRALQAPGRRDRRRPDRDRAQRLAGRGDGSRRVHRRRGAGRGPGGGAGHPRPARDHARRLPRHDRGAGHPDQRWRHQQPRGGRGTW